jgi:hypothetical protein
MPEELKPKKSAIETLQEGGNDLYNGLREGSPGKLWKGLLGVAVSPFKGVFEIIDKTRNQVKNVMHERDKAEQQAQQFQAEGFTPVHTKTVKEYATLSQSEAKENIRFSEVGPKKFRLETGLIFPTGYAPCRIEMGQQVFERGDKLPPNCRLEAGITFVSDPSAIRNYLEYRGQGMEPKTGMRGLLQSYLKKSLRIAAPLIPVTIGSVAGLAALAGGVGLGGYMTALGLGGLATIGTPLLLTATGVGLGGAWLARYFTPKIIARPLYALGKTGELNEQNISSAINQNTNKFDAEYNIATSKGTGQYTHQQGDIVIGRNESVASLGLMQASPHRSGSFTSGFQAIDGKVYRASDVLPVGTVIPHGTVWRNGGKIPASSEYKAVAPFNGSVLKSSDLAKNRSIQIMEDCEAEADLILGATASFSFPFTDESASGVHYPAGSSIPSGTVLPKKYKLIAGTVLPAGTHMPTTQSISGKDLNTASNKTVPSPAWHLTENTVLRRSIEAPNGIEIPNAVAKNLYIIEGSADMSETVINESPELKPSRNGYQKLVAKNGIFHAGTRLPAGALIPGGTKLMEKNYAADTIRSNRHLDSDITLTSTLNLGTLAISANPDNPENMVLRVSDTMKPIGQDFFDPVNKQLHPKNQPIPAGAHIPGVNQNGLHISLPAGLVIPGGSIMFDKSDKNINPHATESEDEGYKQVMREADKILNESESEDEEEDSTPPTP